ncbi:MAG: DUF3108 domain-containing protein [Bacteroidales bacterium]|nr:DUF3108 domain-containing protein [Bacteroidales bacterium]
MKSKMSHIAGLLAAMMLSLTASADDGNTCFPVTPVSELPFAAGEHIRLQFHYKWGMLNADVAKFDIHISDDTYKGRPVYYMEGSGKTIKLVSSFFDIRYKFESWASHDMFKPLKAGRNAVENNYTVNGTQVFDWKAHTVSVDTKSSRHGHKMARVGISDCTMDLLTAIYQIRRTDITAMRPGDSMTADMVIDHGVYPVTLKYIGKTTISVKGLGLVRAVKFSCSVVAGDLFEEDSEEAYLWLTDDANRLPVYVKAELKMGSVVGRLIYWEGLKNEFTSRAR